MPGPTGAITALTAVSGSVDPTNDLLEMVDVSDTTLAATGTNKKVTPSQLAGATSGVVTTSTNYTVAEGVSLVLADATSANVTITLDATKNAGRRVTVQKTDAAGVHDVLFAISGGGTAMPTSLTTLTTQGQVAHFISDGVSQVTHW